MFKKSSTKKEVEMLNDNEKEAVMETLKLARLAIIAILVAGGYMAQDIILGMI
mgnify:CR=1 FL=1